MNSKIENAFGIGKLTGLTWGEIKGYAGEVTRADGDVSYRGIYLCTVYNDDTGGDTLDADGVHMTDEQVQHAIDQIDSVL